MLDTVKRASETWDQYWIRLGRPEMIGKWNPPANSTQTKDTLLKEDPPMDLGKLLLDLGTSYVQTKYGPQQIQAQPAGYTGLPIPWTDYQIEPDIPFIDIAKRSRKTRRRRRRLATLSDIRDLAALQNILGAGKAFTTWIATHPS